MFQTVKIMPGVKAVQTPTLLQTNIVASQNIRWMGGLPEKLGGWSNITPTQYEYGMPGTGRTICAWTDLSNNPHIVVAGIAQGSGFLYHSPGPSGVLIPITPNQFPSSGGATFTPASGSPLIQISDPIAENAGVLTNTTIQICTHVAVGGLVLFGNYPVVAVTTSPSPPRLIYTINAGANATNSTPVTTTAAAQFTTTVDSANILVTLPNHGLTAGQTFQVSMPTTLTGANLTLQGIYTVLASPAPTTNTFYISASWPAQAVVTLQNEANLAGSAYLIYWNPQVAGIFSAAGNPFPMAGSNPTPYPNVTGDSWSLGNFGPILIANPMNGGLFSWNPANQPGSSAYAQIIPNAPTIATGFFIAMPQQMIVAYGAAVGSMIAAPGTTTGQQPAVGQVQDPMLVAWCDAGNMNVWTPGATNQAGTYRLTRGSKIIGGLQGPQQAVLWTDVGLWVMAYVGYPDVWGFNEVAQGCGLVAKDAAGVAGPMIYWMGIDGFWVYTNGATQRLPCDVWDIIFRNINLAYVSHIRCAVNSSFTEVAWHFPSQWSPDGENDSFVKFNTLSGEWDFTVTAGPPAAYSPQMQVTAWIDNNIFGNAISCMVNPIWHQLPPVELQPFTMLVQHETSPDAVQENLGGAWSALPIAWSMTTGFFMLMEGEEYVFVDFVLPDFRWRRWPLAQSTSATISFTLYVANDPDNPNAPPVAFGPFTVTNVGQAGRGAPNLPGAGFEPRCRGRYFYAVISGNDLGSFARLGGIKFRFSADGRNP